MNAGVPELVAQLQAQITAEGPIPFSRFMATVLYDSPHGYYGSGRAVVGRRGDFFTNVSVGPLFGRLIASQVVEIWEHLGSPAVFTVVEQGAHGGEFAGDFLAGIERQSPALFEVIRYRIVEPQANLRTRQQSALASNPKVSWLESVAELEPFFGVHFSNELLDAMPIHLVHRAGGRWHERRVDWQEGRFVLVDGPVSSPELAERISALALPATEGYQTEINLEARRWLAELAPKLERGCILAVDYGYPRESFYSPERSEGTLSAYHQHRRTDPLENVGLSDLTAHVEFTSLIEHAAHLGLECAGLTDQHRFMAGLGRAYFPDTAQPPTPERQREMRAFMTLMHPGLMGASFKVLALTRNLPQPLRGFAPLDAH